MGFFFFKDTAHGMWDFSFAIRDRTCTPCNGVLTITPPAKCNDGISYVTGHQGKEKQGVKVDLDVEIR